MSNDTKLLESLVRKLDAIADANRDKFLCRFDISGSGGKMRFEFVCEDGDHNVFLSATGDSIEAAVAAASAGIADACTKWQYLDAEDSGGSVPRHSSVEVSFPPIKAATLRLEVSRTDGTLWQWAVFNQLAYVAISYGTMGSEQGARAAAVATAVRSLRRMLQERSTDIDKIESGSLSLEWVST